LLRLELLERFEIVGQIDNDATAAATEARLLLWPRVFVDKIDNALALHPLKQVPVSNTDKQTNKTLASKSFFQIE
jgi:hypothetical protein